MNAQTAIAFTLGTIVGGVAYGCVRSSDYLHGRGLYHEGLTKLRTLIEEQKTLTPGFTLRQKVARDLGKYYVEHIIKFRHETWRQRFMIDW